MGERFNNISRAVHVLRERVQTPSPELFGRYQQERQRVKDIYCQVAGWHGTGRYQYRNNGDVTDVLANIAGIGLSPSQDRFLPSHFDSISTSHARPYALIYATVHFPEGEDYQYQYHSSKFWFLKVAQNTFGKIFRRSQDETADNDITARVAQPTTKNAGGNVDNWGRKFTQKAIDPHNADEARSDIEGNYPIVVGIKSNAIPYSRIGAHEKRYHKTIPATDITHIEVPLSHVEETEHFLKERGVSLPVIPIEFGELYSSEFKPKTLVDGNPFSKS